MSIFNGIRTGEISRAYVGIMNIRLCVGAIIMGLLFTVASGIAIAAPKKERLPSEATVAVIEESYNTDGELEHHVFVDYEVNGKSYNHVAYGAYTSSMHEGDTVEIEYSVDDPYDIVSPGAKNIPYAFLGFGLIILAIGITLAVRSKRSAQETDEYDDTVEDVSFDK